MKKMGGNHLVGWENVAPPNRSWWAYLVISEEIRS